ncbi:related to Protein mlo2 [Melanopsichium pennsylvanicum]|uniref:Related to Protein mlo2 n=2 Tax=Melanopsichium pennsylvanicum TaxID=63383 RepID=A0AAJ4XM74_9BASI|nr:related to Protein mlo2 [Melanopsichium pennsylvanicum 4]SNX84934.1 related to Protein mlo2 [Melanopsichium pennsylvanicum]
MSEDNKAASFSTAASGSTSMLRASASVHLPDPSLPAPNLGEDELGFTAADLIAQQSRLEAQANEAIPFQFDTCTHHRGYIRQPVYACKTCGGGGVCAGCSVSCHAEHELVELFNKRKFRCDCGTPNLYRQQESNRMNRFTRLTGELKYREGAKPCTLRKPGFDPQNDANVYNHNFDGEFCYCERGKTYDPEKEDETMFQCIVCEEWLHESCTSLHPASTSDATQVDQTTRDAAPPLIDHDLFDLMICDVCVRNPGNEILRRYAGAKGWMVLAPSQDVTDVTEHDQLASIQVPTDEELKEAGGPYRDGRSWQIFGLAMEVERESTQTEVGAAADRASLSSVADLARSTVATASEMMAEAPVESAVKDTAKIEDASDGEVPTAAAEIPQDLTNQRREGKRRAEEDGEQGVSKRTKAGTTEGALEPQSSVPANEGVTEGREQICTLPESLGIVASLAVSEVDDWTPAFSVGSGSQRYDIFLGEDFRERICRCTTCLPRWAHLPHVLDAEETYAPPSDPHASVRDDDAASISSSTYDLGMAALRSMPREKMINSLHAYSKFRDALWEHLKPFAGTGKMVREEDVRAFFKKKLGTDQ